LDDIVVSLSLWGVRYLVFVVAGFEERKYTPSTIDSKNTRSGTVAETMRR